MKKRKLEDMTDLKEALNYDLLNDKLNEINKKLDFLINKIQEMDEKYYSLEERIKPINKDCHYIS